VNPEWPSGADGTLTLSLAELGVELHPGRRYRVRALVGDRAIGRCSFSTAPAGRAARFAVAVASCHLPFADDGEVDEAAVGFLRSLPAALDAHDVERTMWMGDQIYADQPAGLGLFDDDGFAGVAPEGRGSVLECTRQEVRSLLHARYRAFFDVPGFDALWGARASVAVPDDHEIVDNYGSDPAHASEDRWRQYAAGALDAFFDYQGSANHATRPEAFDKVQHYAQAAMISLDLRSQRRVTDEGMVIVSDAQLERLRSKLRAAGDRDVVIIGLSVAIYHVPEGLSLLGKLLGSGSNLDDRWSNPQAADNRKALLTVLHDHQRAHPHQRLVLVSGDVHVGAMSELRWRDATLPPMLQLTASALSNRRPDLESWAAAMAPSLVTLPDGDGPIGQVAALAGLGDANPYPELNLGLVEVESVPPGEGEAASRVRLTLLGRGDSGDAVPVLQSHWLPCGAPHPERLTDR